MRLIEADAKGLLRQSGLGVPPGAHLLHDGDEQPPGDAAVAVKAQVLKGNRAGAGLVELVSGEQAAAAVRRVSDAMVRGGESPLVLVEQQVPFAAEYSAAWRIDDLLQQPTLLFSRSGGTGIEARADQLRIFAQDVLADLTPYRLLPFLRDIGVPPEHFGALARYCVGLYEIFRREDALLLEINPLVITTRGQAMALDAKMIVDDYATPRHLEWRDWQSARLQYSDSTALETKAAKEGFTFVELPGRIAVFSAGAGLGMCLTDLLAEAGLPAANFSDATGGAGIERWEGMAAITFERAARPDVDAVLVHFVLTATSLKNVVLGLLRVVDRTPNPKPIIVCLICAAASEKEMTMAECRALLEARGQRCVTTLQEAIAALRDVAGPGKAGAA